MLFSGLNRSCIPCKEARLREDMMGYWKIEVAGRSGKTQIDNRYDDKLCSLRESVTERCAALQGGDQ